MRLIQYCGVCCTVRITLHAVMQASKVSSLPLFQTKTLARPPEIKKETAERRRDRGSRPPSPPSFSFFPLRHPHLTNNRSSVCLRASGWREKRGGEGSPGRQAGKGGSDWKSEAAEEGAEVICGLCRCGAKIHFLRLVRFN